MKKTALFACLLTLLTACTSTPPKTLDQKLSEAQSPSDRREVLRLACLNEAEVVNDKVYRVQAPSKGRSKMNTSRSAYNEARKAKAMCRRLNNFNESLDASTPQVKADLSRECSTLLKEYAEKYPADTRHVSAMERICGEMLGKRKGE